MPARDQLDQQGQDDPRDRPGPARSRGPVDPDVDLHDPSSGPEWARHRYVLPTIAVGGMVGASARHALELAWPVASTGFPWATFATNVVGCLLIGVLMAYVVDLGAGHPLLRPFVGTGVLGGFTTFSTYATQTTHLVAVQRPALALVYLAGTVLAALAAVAAGLAVGRRLWDAHGQQEAAR